MKKTKSPPFKSQLSHFQKLSQLMVFLEPDGLVSLVAGVESEEREWDNHVPNVGGAAVDRHRVLVMPLVGKTGRSAQNALSGLVAAGEPTRQVDQAGLRKWRIDGSIIAPWDKRT